MNAPTSTPAHRRPTIDFATTINPSSSAPTSSNVKVHDINYILGPSTDKPSKPQDDNAPNTPTVAPGPGTEETSTAASLLANYSHTLPVEDETPVSYTPTTHRISKAKKGKKVHVCEFGCGKVMITISRCHFVLTGAGFHARRAPQVCLHCRLPHCGNNTDRILKAP